MPDKAYPPLQTLRPFPHDAARSYAVCIDKDMPYDGGDYWHAPAVTKNVLFAMIKKAAKTHQALTFRVQVSHGLLEQGPRAQEDTDLFCRVDELLKEISPEGYASFFSHGGRDDERARVSTTTYVIWLFCPSQEKIPYSREDNLRQGRAKAMFPELFPEERLH